MNYTLLNTFRFTIIILFCICTVKAEAQKKNTPPNIIIIFPDDLGYGDLGINGHPSIKTPNIDQLAMNGLRLTNFYSGSPACTASRYSLLTGKYPVHSGFNWVLYPTENKGLDPSEKTIAKALKEVGYSTAIFGKWHLGNGNKDFMPLNHGFDEYLGLPYSNDMIPPKFPDLALIHNNDTLELNPDQSKLTALYTKKTQEFIIKNKKKPFFVYVPFAMPHVPLYPGKDFIGKSKRGLYGDAVEELDWAVGQILQTLENENLSKNTIVWFASDNGPWILKDEEGGSAGLFRDGKGSTWEGGMRVPSIVYWPNKIKKGTINQSPASTLDIYKSLLGFAGGKVNHKIQGRNLQKLLLDNIEPDEQPFFYYGLNNELMAVRKGKWKLHIKTYSQINADYFKGKLPLLFDLEIDPSEKYDLSDKKPEVVLGLQKLIEVQKKETTKL